MNCLMFDGYEGVGICLLMGAPKIHRISLSRAIHMHVLGGLW